MVKKKLGFNPFDEIDLLKGPTKKAAETSGKLSGGLSGITSGKLSGETSGNVTIATKDKHKKYSFYVREDQLHALIKLSKKSGYKQSELARMALDLFIENVKVKK